MKLDSNGHDSTQSQCISSSPPLFVAIREQMIIEYRLKVLAKVINVEEE